MCIVKIRWWQLLNAVPYHDTTILFSWGFCYKFLHKRSHLEVFSTKIKFQLNLLPIHTMMTRNTSIFTYKIIQSAAITALTLQKVIFTISFKWYTLLIWRLTLSFYKITKNFFSLKSCMQISALCVKFNDQSECNFTTIS